MKRTTMNILLIAINAKYIHSNLAVRSLRSYAMESLARKAAPGQPASETVSRASVPAAEAVSSPCSQTNAPRTAVSSPCPQTNAPRAVGSPLCSQTNAPRTAVSSPCSQMNAPHPAGTTLPSAERSGPAHPDTENVPCPAAAAARNAQPVQIDLAEYTINQPMDSILRDIYRRRPDILCFSCYIWNIRYVRELVRDLGKVLPWTAIWLGGPEVSYDAAKQLEEMPELSGVMKGEGEETFAELVSAYIRAADETEPSAAENRPPSIPDSVFASIAGITWRGSGGRITENPWRPVMDMNRLPFVYRDMDDLEHKIIYYESSRGCPFSCSYCLSSVDKHLRFRDIGLVKKELKFFIDHRVPQVKFVDRTFNCLHRHAMEIWRFIIENDQGVTNFHFELSADLLNEEEIALLQSMRPGLVQLEIGVQSTRPETIRAIHRTMDFPRLAEIVRAIAQNGNIHQHLDLIAGLPYEDLASFRRSFDDVYALKPQQLQLGFLKVLKGSYMEEHRQEYGLLCQSTPPYEVLATRWLRFDDILLLKGVEEMVETYYNSGQFTRTLAELEREFDSAFSLYLALSEYCSRRVPEGASQARAARYELMLGFITETLCGSAPENAASPAACPTPESPAVSHRLQTFRELLICDYYLRENAKSRPAFAGEYTLSKDELTCFYEKEAARHKYLSGLLPDRSPAGPGQLRRMTHLERFEHLGKIVLFDYERRDPLTENARTCIVAAEDLTADA